MPQTCPGPGVPVHHAPAWGTLGSAHLVVQADQHLLCHPWAQKALATLGEQGHCVTAEPGKGCSHCLCMAGRRGGTAQGGQSLICGQSRAGQSQGRAGTGGLGQPGQGGQRAWPQGARSGALSPCPWEGNQSPWSLNPIQPPTIPMRALTLCSWRSRTTRLHECLPGKAQMAAEGWSPGSGGQCPTSHPHPSPCPEGWMELEGVQSQA